MFHLDSAGSSVSCIFYFVPQEMLNNREFKMTLNNSVIAYIYLRAKKKKNECCLFKYKHSLDFIHNNNNNNKT